MSYFNSYNFINLILCTNRREHSKIIIAHEFRQVHLIYSNTQIGYNYCQIFSYFDDSDAVFDAVDDAPSRISRNPFPITAFEKKSL